MKKPKRESGAGGVGQTDPWGGQAGPWGGGNRPPPSTGTNGVPGCMDTKIAYETSSNYISKDIKQCIF